MKALGAVGLVAMIGAATPAVSQTISWYSPRAFAYSGVLGGETSYVVVAYQVSNKTGSMQFNSWEIVLQGPGGQQFEDGFHPMVKARFCSEFSSYCPGGTTGVKDAINSKGELLPGSKIDALAIFDVKGSFPDALKMAFKTFEGLQHHTSYKLDGHSYSEVKTERTTKKPQAASKNAQGAPKPPPTLDTCLKACGPWAADMPVRVAECRQDCYKQDR